MHSVMTIKEQNKEGLARRSTRTTKIGTRRLKRCRHKASKMKNAKSMDFMKFPKGIGKCQAAFAVVVSNWRHVSSRYYFTSASHMFTLLNILKLGTDSILIDEKDREVNSYSS